MKEKKKPLETGGGWREFGSFFKNVKVSWGLIILTLVISIVYYFAVSMIPDTTAALYAGEFTTAAIMGVVINYGATLVLSLANSVANIFADAVSVRRARNSVWKRMMGIRTDFYNDNDPGRFLSAITSDAETTVTSIINVIIMLPSLVVYLFMCLSMVAGYSTKLLAVLFVLVPAYILYAVFMGRWQQKVGCSIQTRIGGLTGFLSERIRNLGLIKAFVTEKREEERGLETAKELYGANVQLQYINGVLVAFTFVTDAVATVVAVIWGCMLLRRGEINLEQWLAFFMFVPMINTVLRQLSMLWGNIKELQGRAARLGYLMEAPQEDTRPGARTDIPAGDIEFRGVTFGYKPGTDSVSGVNITVPRGKNTAVVGLSGSGKTTLLRLLEQLYTPKQGSITVGGVDIGTLDLTAWRAGLSYVPQDAEIFSGTVRECLTYGIGREIGDSELESAARTAGVWEYIDSIGGLDAPLAIWGTAMSGGQRQRIVIARELLKDADIILLDEPTSALDAGTAAEISDTIYKQFAGKTVITVTHELSFISGADQIIVMAEGRVIDCGTHEKLMVSCPIYRELVEDQSYQEVYGA